MYCCVRYNKQNARKDSVLPVIFSCVRGGSCPHIMKPSFSCHYACHARLISFLLLKLISSTFREHPFSRRSALCEILEGHYSGTFVSMAFYHDAVHSRSRPVSGQCIGDPQSELTIIPEVRAAHQKPLYSVFLLAQKEDSSYPPTRKQS